MKELQIRINTWADILMLMAHLKKHDMDALYGADYAIPHFCLQSFTDYDEEAEYPETHEFTLIENRPVDAFSLMPAPAPNTGYAMGPTKVGDPGPEQTTIDLRVIDCTPEALDTNLPWLKAA